MKDVIIRAGCKEDIPQVFELVKELAEFERAPEQVTNTIERMEVDGFGPNPVYGMFVAESDHHIVGISVYYYRYSTWKGRRLYLEDIIVTQSARGKGIGTLLFNRTLLKTLEDQCTGMNWQVLDWNEPAIRFYKKYQASFSAEWIDCALDAHQIKTLITI